MASGNDHSSSNSSTISQAIEMPNANTNHKIVCPLANFPPDIWGDRFLTLPFTDSELESCSRQVEALKAMVKDILMSSVDDAIENILVINSLFRLGVSYHFESEIEEQLSSLFTSLPQHITHNDCDLYTISIIFLVFRSHGYKITSDVFTKFKNSEGKFKEEMRSDIKGLISLYEASHWRMNRELILEEALSFTKSQLELNANQLSTTPSASSLADYIVHALQWPQQRSIPRMDARYYISFYEKHETQNEKDVFLKFAKLDFNRVQMLLQQELSLLSCWCKESNLKSRFPYARHRMVEFFIMAMGVYFEPHFARARVIFTKAAIVFTFIDDAYDAYGIYEELKYLTKAIHRFDHGTMDELPAEYLKTLYETVLNICKEFEEEVSKEGRAYSVSYTVEELKKLALVYDIQAQWTHECLELPTFDEYFANGKRTSATVFTLCCAMIGMEEAHQNAFEWLRNPQCALIEAVCKLARLYNDIQSNEEEEKRGGQVSGTACYMKQYGCSKEEAIEAFKGMIEVAWKDLNKAFMRPWPTVPTQIIVGAYNLAGLIDLWYKNDDGISNPELSLKHHIIKMLVDPIPIQ